MNRLENRLVEKVECHFFISTLAYLERNRKARWEKEELVITVFLNKLTRGRAPEVLKKKHRFYKFAQKNGC